MFDWLHGRRVAAEVAHLQAARQEARLATDTAEREPAAPAPSSSPPPALVLDVLSRLNVHGNSAAPSGPLAFDALCGAAAAFLPSLLVVEQRGRFRLGPQQPWMAMEGRSHLSLLLADPTTEHTGRRCLVPGFVWTAHMRLALPYVPWLGLYLYCLDTLVGGVGAFCARLLNLPLARGQPSPELNLSALGRYLAEAVLMAPGALATDTEHIAWEELELEAAEADGGRDGGGVPAGRVLEVKLRVGASSEMMCARVRLDEQHRPLAVEMDRFRDCGAAGQKLTRFCGRTAGEWRLLRNPTSKACGYLPSAMVAAWRLPPEEGGETFDWFEASLTYPQLEAMPAPVDSRSD